MLGGDWDEGELARIPALDLAVVSGWFPLFAFGGLEDEAVAFVVDEDMGPGLAFRWERIDCEYFKFDYRPQLPLAEVVEADVMERGVAASAVPLAKLGIVGYGPSGRDPAP